ncbi:hypothetical protein GK051_02300 [Escherichia coli]|nr:hypothetical protein [Escherichia coli]EJF7989509.1 hypothetical protein [Escherichia coli]MDT5386215.1 hypothetical protein [Escherichia coli]HBD3043708.1 hypothetical protein [Escherichia coli]HBD3310892.1 hypothetical protein [Escherichia coli]
MKLALTLEADSVNVQALNMGRIVVDVDGVNLAELINKVSEIRTLSAQPASATFWLYERVHCCKSTQLSGIK